MLSPVEIHPALARFWAVPVLQGSGPAGAPSISSTNHINVHSKLSALEIFSPSNVEDIAL